MNEHPKPKFQALQPGQQVPIDMKNAVLKPCECGCRYFESFMELYTISALLSPTGKKLIAQKPVLICLECKAVMEVGGVS